MTSYIRQSDGKPVTEDEALLNGVLKQGYRASFSLMNKDHAPGGTKIMIHDSATRFMDALPTAQAARINEIIADAGSNEVFRVQRARKAARDLSCMLNGAAHTDTSLTTDSFKRANLEGAAFMMTLADKAQQREQDLYASDGGLHAAAARVAMQERDASAWSRTTGQQTDSRVTADSSAGVSSEDAYAQMKSRDANAWRVGK